MRTFPLQPLDFARGPDLGSPGVLQAVIVVAAIVLVIALILLVVVALRRR